MNRVVLKVDTLTVGVPMAAGHVVLIAGSTAPLSLRRALLMLQPGDTVRTTVSLAPMHPTEAVGGRPVLVRRGAPLPLDSSSFTTSRHPRTAVGIAEGGGRVMLVTVDGRQPPYSDGMSLRELTALMLGLGSHEALNLDGGGSTTMVLAGAMVAGGARVINRPSDPGGERPVANALAVVGCRR